MPAVRFSRDKRGYEYVYLVHTPTRRGKPGRTRVLYWYRTPPGVRVGRKPFDQEVQRAVEQQNPGVTFDWPAIINAEMPPPDMTEFWRERRRLEKAARQERRAAEAEETGEAPEPEPSEPLDAAAADSPVADAEPAGSTAEAADVERAVDAPGENADAAGASPAQKKRRRRRGGRRRKGAVAAAEGGEAGQSDGEGEASDDNETDSAGDEPSE